MKLSKEDEELYREFAKASLQGWLAHYPETASYASINYGVVATGALRMAAAMMNAYKHSLGSTEFDISKKK